MTTYRACQDSEQGGLGGGGSVAVSAESGEKWLKSHERRRREERAAGASQRIGEISRVDSRFASYVDTQSEVETQVRWKASGKYIPRII